MSDTATNPRGGITYEELQKLWYMACEERDGLYRDNAELKVRLGEALSERDAANRDAKAAIVSLNEASKFVAFRIENAP